MKTIVTCLLLMTFFTACDAPQRTRSIGNSFGNGLNYSGTEGSQTTGSLGGTTTGSTSGSTTAGTTSGTTSGNTSTLPQDFSACNTGTPFYSAGIGYTSLCQSTSNESSIRVMFTSADQELGTCLIPTYKDTTGSSMYLGQPQCTLHTANQVIYGSLPKTRVGFTQYPINGAMVMKRSSLSAYFSCMDAYVSFGTAAYPVSGCPYGAQTSPACHQAAQNYMNSLCSQFRAQHSYMDIRLKN